MVVKDVAVNTLDPDELSLQLKREMMEYPSRVGWCVPTEVFAERGQEPRKNIEVGVCHSPSVFCFLYIIGHSVAACAYRSSSAACYTSSP